MLDPASPRRNWASILSLVIPLAMYAALVIPATVQQGDRINPDAVCYIRQATYLAHGQWAVSVSGYWSPLLSWCIAPLVKAGVDGLRAAHAVLAMWGGLYLIACHALLRRFPAINVPCRTLLLCAVAVAAVRLALGVVTPDIPLATCLLAYLAVALRPELLRRPGLALLAGGLGGAAYLAKSYGMPFFLAHWALVAGYHAVRARRAATGNRADDAATENGPLAQDRPWRRAVLAWGIGMAAFVAVAGPWVGVLSAKYGRLTFNTVAARAHAIVGAHADTRQHVFGVPPEPYLALAEVVDSLPDQSWSPLASGENFRYQLQLIGVNATEMVRAFWALDGLHLATIGAAAALVLLAVPRLGRPQRGGLLFLLATAALYCGGFLLVYYEPRYVNPMLIPLTMTIATIVIGRVVRWNAREGEGRTPGVRPSLAVGRGQRMELAAVAVLAASFLVIALPLTAALLVTPRKSPHRTVAAQLRKAKVHGPIACTSYADGLFSCFFAGERYAGFPPAGTGLTAGQHDEALRQAGVKALLVWPRKRAEAARKAPSAAYAAIKATARPPDANLVEEICRQGGWRLQSSFKIAEKANVGLYVRQTGAPATRPANGASDGEDLPPDGDGSDAPP